MPWLARPSVVSRFHIRIRVGDGSQQRPRGHTPAPISNATDGEYRPDAELLAFTQVCAVEQPQEKFPKRSAERCQHARDVRSKRKAVIHSQ